MNALALAKRLEKYRHDQGYPAARFWTEPLDERLAKIDTYEVYQKCNLVNGLQPRIEMTADNLRARSQLAKKAASKGGSGDGRR